MFGLLHAVTWAYPAVSCGVLQPQTVFRHISLGLSMDLVYRCTGAVTHCLSVSIFTCLL